MVSPKLEPKACWEFEGEILVLHHPTTISVRYQAMGEWSLIYVYNWMNSHDTGNFIIIKKGYCGILMILWWLNFWHDSVPVHVQ